MYLPCLKIMLQKWPGRLMEASVRTTGVPAETNWAAASNAVPKCNINFAKSV